MRPRLALLVVLAAAPAAAGQSVAVSFRHDVAVSHPMAGLEAGVRLGAGQLRAGVWHGGRVTPEATFCPLIVGLECPLLSRHGTTTEARLGWAVESVASERTRVYAGPHVAYLHRTSAVRAEGERVGRGETARSAVASAVVGLRWRAADPVALSAEMEVGAERVLSTTESFYARPGQKRTFARFLPSAGVAVALGR